MISNKEWDHFQQLMECSNYQWPFQEPKWEVPTIFMAYVWAHNMVFLVPPSSWILFKIPIEIHGVTPRRKAEAPGGSDCPASPNSVERATGITDGHGGFHGVFVGGKSTGNKHHENVSLENSDNSESLLSHLKLLFSIPR